MHRMMFNGSSRDLRVAALLMKEFFSQEDFKSKVKGGRGKAVKNDRTYIPMPREPMKSDPQLDRYTKVCMYDDSGIHEEYQSMRLRGELKKALWFSPLRSIGFSEWDIDRCTERTSTQHSTTFQNPLWMKGRNAYRFSTRVTVQRVYSTFSELSGMDSVNVKRLWLDVGGRYSTDYEYDSPAAINSAGPEASRRIGNWLRESHWHNTIWMMPWDSVLVEIARLVLRRWRGVCSFSQTMRGTGAMQNVIWCMTFVPKNKVGLKNDLLKSFLKVQKYDDISIT
jgi:hypothetical protein